MGFFSKALGTVGGWLNDVTGITDTANKSYKQNVDLWRMQNEYNSPLAQIARMKQAGIDVNPMTYAVGNGNMSNTASSVGSPSYSGSGINPLSTIMGIVDGVKNLSFKDAEIENLKASATQTITMMPQRIANMIAERDRTSAEIAKTYADIAVLQHNLKIAQERGDPVGVVPSWRNNLFSSIFGGIASRHHANKRFRDERDARRAAEGYNLDLPILGSNAGDYGINSISDLRFF